MNNTHHRPTGDDALDWLLTHDPLATEVSEREYAKATGIVSPVVAGDIVNWEDTTAEVPLKAADLTGREYS